MVIFSWSLNLHPNYQSACEKIRSGKIPVNGQQADPQEGSTAKTVFQEFLDTDPEFQDLSVLKVMLQAGANLEQPDASGHYPIHQAARLWGSNAIANGCVRMTHMLLNEGAQVNRLNHLDQVPLVYALARAEVLEGHDYYLPTLIDLLLSHGATFPDQASK